MEVTMQTTLKELLEIPAVHDLLGRAVPQMIQKPAVDYISGMKLEELAGSLPPGMEALPEAILDAAAGREVHLELKDPRKIPPELKAGGIVEGYSLDEVDGMLYMLDHRFTGCIVCRFSKRMDESVRGTVTCEGREMPWTLASISVAGGQQMLGIYVRDIAIEYDTSYTLSVSGFADTDGNVMTPAEYTFKTLPKSTPDAAYAEHDAVAQRAAEESMVLLKNEAAALPLDARETVALYGADDFRISAVGAGKINPRYVVRLRQAVEESTLSVDADGGTAIVVISRASGENYDNNACPGEFYLTKEEEAQLSVIRAKHKKVVAVLSCGYPMDVRWLDTLPVDAAVWTGFSGMLGGRALVRLLTGEVCPSGHLPDTWSLTWEDIPSSKNFYQPPTPEEAPDADCGLWIDTVYEEDLYVGYRYYETFQNPVAYPFGHGLSYTTFVREASAEEGEEPIVRVRVTNTGAVAGRDLVQIYAAIPEGTLEQPARRLVAFAKTALLAPGKTEELVLSLSDTVLSSFDEERAQWVMEDGLYRLYAGENVRDAEEIGSFTVGERRVIRQVKNLCRPPVEIERMSKRAGTLPVGAHSGAKPDADGLKPLRKMRAPEPVPVTEEQLSAVADWTSEQLARFAVCASAGWGMHEKGEAGRIFKVDGLDLPDYSVADGNNGVNLNKPNIGMPSSNLLCASWDPALAREVGAVIGEEAKENDIQMILAPAMNLHRNPLCGRHPEYFSEDPLLAGVMAGMQCRGLEEAGVGTSVKHVACNNSEASRKRNHSILSERALRELYLKGFEIALQIQMPASIMTGYNAMNGVFTAEDEELLGGIFREEFGFTGFVMTDWNSYDTADVARAVQAGNCWMTPGSKDNTYVDPILEGLQDGVIDEDRLRANAALMLDAIR